MRKRLKFIVTYAIMRLLEKWHRDQFWFQVWSTYALGSLVPWWEDENL